MLTLDVDGTLHSVFSDPAPDERALIFCAPVSLVAARRIKGELRKIDTTLSKPSICRFDETWIPFFESRTKRAFACDFITVETAFPRRLYIFALWNINTREIIAASVTRNPTANWLGRFLLDCNGIRLYRTPPQRASRSQNLFKRRDLQESNR